MSDKPIRCQSLEIRLEDLRVLAHIGAHPHEKGRRQGLRIAVALKLDHVPGDCLTETVDYSMVADMAEKLAERHIILIETFGWELARMCLGQPGVSQAQVIVEKPSALPNGTASICILLDRTEL